MRSRIWWVLLCAMLAVCASVAQAQQSRKVPRLGYLAAVSASADAPRLEAFRRGLRDLGYVEGQSILIDYRHESHDLQRLPSLAAELIALDIDVLVAVTSNAAQAAARTTRSVPIVFMGVTDPIATGLAESLARPGGNATGITNVAAILTGKRLELLKEVLPSVKRVAVLWDPLAPGSVPQWQASQVPAETLGLQLYSMEASSAAAYVDAFKDAVKARSTAVWVTLNPVANSNQKTIAEMAIAHGLPTICARSDYAENGCLMAYGPGYGNEGKDGARYVDRILKGAKPADLPIEQPTKFELLVNLQTAKRLGLTIPRAVLNRADKLIQ
ncbi:ABC transporter substrate-binding protein [Variovorax saccharolyticus]|uniref:ABC transporter substrate-binding protein n=1 Tax=Variovorax saccharolyticus TaxID=3053516 RepID=UPI0025751615|nr:MULTISPECIES: ABC transporter substrate-binding protein [unclassified Variovorax]MDM0017809.1 ABC transporter substrate-binding protein [Variovorax sp. J22R187]MDM0024779.1 ABC transporter substrate-binding protein [Variovorax sp. J31P216]